MNAVLTCNVCNQPLRRGEGPRCACEEGLKEGEWPPPISWSLREPPPSPPPPPSPDPIKLLLEAGIRENREQLKEMGWLCLIFLLAIALTCWNDPKTAVIMVIFLVFSAYLVGFLIWNRLERKKGQLRKLQS